MKAKLYILTVVTLLSCNTPKEVVMPFVNMGYSGERLFPVAESEADFTFRAWVSFSTNIDRVFSVAYDEDWGVKSSRFLEIRRQGLFNERKDKTTLKETFLSPRSGVEKFVAKVDSLNLMEMKDQEDNKFSIALHEPVALYVIEIKRHGKFNHFQFKTHLVNQETIENKYQKIVDLIINELPFDFYYIDQQKKP